MSWFSGIVIGGFREVRKVCARNRVVSDFGYICWGGRGCLGDFRKVILFLGVLGV